MKVGDLVMVLNNKYDNTGYIKKYNNGLYLNY